MHKLRAALGQPGELPSTERHTFGNRTYSRVDIEQNLSRSGTTGGGFGPPVFFKNTAERSPSPVALGGSPIAGS